MATANKFQSLLTKATDCVITIKGIDDTETAKVFATAKTAVWELAKVCFYLNKVEGIKLETLESKFDVSKATIGKHAVNVAWLLEKFGKGFDSYADYYSVSKVDLIRKALESGCYKGVKFEDLITKKRSDIEKAIEKASKKASNNGNNTDEKTEKTVSIRMIGEDGVEIVRTIDSDTWKVWVEEYNEEKAE